MWTDVTLKCPDEGEWVALTRVNADGETVSLGYVNPETLTLVAASLRPLLARSEEEGHESMDTVLAWRDFARHIAR